MKMLAVMMCVAASSAAAKIPDFTAANAPDIIKKSANPKAREFYAELVDHTKKESRQMVEDMKGKTGVKPSDLKKVDWDCLFWRNAATFARNLRRRFPGLQPPEFADIMEKIALDDDCPDEGGPGSKGVQVYNAVMLEADAKRGGWQMAGLDMPANSNLLRLIQGMMAAGAGAGGASQSIAPAAAGGGAGVVPLIGNPHDYTPSRLRETPDTL